MNKEVYCGIHPVCTTAEFYERLSEEFGQPTPIEDINTDMITGSIGSTFLHDNINIHAVQFDRNACLHIYNIKSKGVVLINEVYLPKATPPKLNRIILVGSKKDVGEVEKIVLEEVAKLKSEPMLAGK